MTTASTIRAWAAQAAHQPLVPFSYEPGPLGAEEVEIRVEHCGVCHSDLSVIDSEWGPAAYPTVGGHEVIGTVVAIGAQARGLRLGQRVGLGWNCSSCMSCPSCLGGQPQLCRVAQPTIMGHHGGFAERVRAHWLWACPIPDGLSAAKAGPLLCGGVTVFSPFLNLDIKPTHRVGVVGIGGLGHLALKFARAWGCEVTAFTSSDAKRDEALQMGAHRVVSSVDPDAMKAIRGRLDLVLVTVNVMLNWKALMSTLAPKGHLHLVGVLPQPMEVDALPLISGLRSVSGSPTGSRQDIDTMLEFAARHGIEPQTEHFPMSRINEALDHVRAGKARYRVVLDADFDQA
ncbi:NADPH-dependent aldehyde reductase Ahr [Aquabacterium sp.]|uniref:NADPH-dependent aldehyde reductase Ahr n=1 Tax=Aquabacterium sp. TaxID=1872578 RepID=UPI003B6E76B8